MRMRALVIGVSGFVGGHLAERLVASGAEVSGIARRPQCEWNFPGSEKVTAYYGCILNEDFLGNCIRKTRPTHVFHLAGVLGSETDNGLALYETNARGTIKVLDSLRAISPAPRILVAGSSAVYGATENLPIIEDEQLRPLTHYAVSKVLQEMVAMRYHLTHGMDIIRTRTFNLVGPGLSRTLLPSEIAYQIALAECGGSSVIRVGNLFPRRDYTDVRDAVSAYVALAVRGQAGEVYNVCRGRSYSVGEIADALIGLTKVPVRIEVEPVRVRRAEIEDQMGDATRLNKNNGWRPLFDLEKSLEDLIDYWRQKLYAKGKICPGGIQKCS